MADRSRRFRSCLLHRSRMFQFFESPSFSSKHLKIISFGKAMAERAGFEPALRSPVNTLSRRAPSTTRPPLRPCIRAGRLCRAGWGDASLWEVRGRPALRAPPTSGCPSRRPSIKQARGSSSRSGAECQAITAVYSLCQPCIVLRDRRRLRSRSAGAPNGVHRQRRGDGRA